MRVTYYFDGGGSHNGSPAGWGWSCHHEGEEIANGKGALAPGSTNNQAEYTALKMAITHAISSDYPPGTMFMFMGDSKLVVEQVQGRWKCNKAHLVVLRDDVQHLLQVLLYGIQWIPREMNTRADELATTGRYRWRG